MAKQSEAKRPETAIAKTELPVAKAAAINRYLVTFNPPSPIGEKARRMEVEAESAEIAIQKWREATGFTGPTAVPPVATELVSETA